MIVTNETVSEIYYISIPRLSAEYATRNVSPPSFTVKTLLLSGATELVSIDVISPVRAEQTDVNSTSGSNGNYLCHP